MVFVRKLSKSAHKTITVKRQKTKQKKSDRFECVSSLSVHTKQLKKKEGEKVIVFFV